MEYLNPTFMLLMAAALAAITAGLHSVLGEQRLLAPLLASDAPPMQSEFARNVTRFAWHWTSVLWLCVGAVLALTAYGEIDAPWLVFGIGAVHFIMGVADAILTRGQHIGWPLITLIGGLTLLAFYTIQTQ
ncbi:hypothetical protein OZN62_01380 [Aurantiacibacter sp. MUD11]|uniref:hypothetical protein n=1 Tax=Aurantiacibacter sp. MUD11 TaxID=3003265 RepID=UPI0022AA88FA|nr:hypothetical protein [Aurantiacibacter sp. MUD11]WAT18254.1 hypothetical protein OZN62_01380 [Aurantiacibacter sp. MUD11]